jgi:choline dehydrogenase
MLSGIGPADDLRALGLPVCVDLPGVGQNLRDHLVLGVGFRSHKETGPSPGLLGEVGLFLRTRPGLGASSPDLQFHFRQTLFVDPAHRLGGPGFTFLPTMVRPQSRGSIRLRSADPFAPPLIQVNYLESENDLAILVEGVRWARRLVRAQAFAEFLPEEAVPGPDVKSDAQVGDYIRQFATTIFHPVGTCKMGRDRLAVVDPQLRVHGVTGLRVADASVMPAVVNANTNAAVIMIGEKAADLMRATP